MGMICPTNLQGICALAVIIQFLKFYFVAAKEFC
jgi:hypothetical protein